MCRKSSIQSWFIHYFSCKTSKIKTIEFFYFSDVTFVLPDLNQDDQVDDSSSESEEDVDEEDSSSSEDDEYGGFAQYGCLAQYGFPGLIFHYLLGMLNDDSEDSSDEEY